MEKRLVTGFEIYQQSNGSFKIVEILKDGTKKEKKFSYEFYANAVCAVMKGIL